MRLQATLCAALLAALCGTAHSGWWIFGQTANEVKVNYLFVAGTQLDETGPKVKIPRSSLKDGLAVISGRASVRKGTIGAVLVSLS